MQLALKDASRARQIGKGRKSEGERTELLEDCSPRCEKKAKFARQVQEQADF